jgi:drug/metabolite transporter (DMT)-like permease
VNSQRAGALAAALASALFFGLNATATKILYSPDAPARFDPIGLVTARSLWTLPLFFAMAILARPRESFCPTRKDLFMFGLCGFAYGPGTTGTYAVAVGLTSVGHAVLLLSLTPAVAAILAAFFLHERLTLTRIAAFFVGTAGAVLLTLTKSAAGATPQGDAVVLMQVIMWASLTLGIRVLARSYPPLFIAGVFGTFGTALNIAIGAAFGKLDAGLLPLQHTDWRTIVWFDLELLLLLSVVAQILQVFALCVLGAGYVAAITAYGTIFVGVIASIAIVGERISAAGIFAALLLTTAMGLALVTPRDKGSSSARLQPSSPDRALG